MCRILKKKAFKGVRFFWEEHEADVDLGFIPMKYIEVGIRWN